MENKREIEIVVLSDIHLGTYGCHAKELSTYLKSIQPGTLILNGDIIDMWQFKKNYWPKHHMKVIKHIINLASKGTKVYYITGNHDETLRRFSGINMGNLSIVNQLELNIDDARVWFFHGDVFDVVMQHSKWLAVLGSISYDLLIRLNTLINNISTFFGNGKISLSKKIKENVKTAVKYINNFELTAAKMANSKVFDTIICGHIHHAECKTIEIDSENSIEYLNSGDWVENLTALEYSNEEWTIFRYSESEFELSNVLNENDLSTDQDADLLTDMNNKDLFNLMLKDFQN